jgi:hypothetical protein
MWGRSYHGRAAGHKSSAQVKRRAHRERSAPEVPLGNAPPPYVLNRSSRDYLNIALMLPQVTSSTGTAGTFV